MGQRVLRDDLNVVKIDVSTQCVEIKSMLNDLFDRIRKVPAETPLWPVATSEIEQANVLEVVQLKDVEEKNKHPQKCAQYYRVKPIQGKAHGEEGGDEIGMLEKLYRQAMDIGRKGRS